MLPLLSLLGFALQLAPPTTAPCHNLQDLRTPAVRSNTGLTASVALHTEDDHGRNTHLCAATYDLILSGPAGTPDRRDNLENSDGPWHRTLSVQIEGFANKGTQLAVVITEAPAPGDLEIILYDTATKTTQISFVPGAFLRHLGKACSQTLHVTATSGTLPVLSTSVTSNCTHANSWLIKPAQGTTKTSSLPWPKPLSPTTKVEPLEPAVATPEIANSR